MNTLSQHDLEQHLRMARRKAPDAPVYGFYLPQGSLDTGLPADGESIKLNIDDQTWRVVNAPSELAIRRAMCERSDDELLAIVTPLSERDLAIDVRVRFPLEFGLFDFNPWGVLQVLFGAPTLSHELVHHDARPLGRALLRSADGRDFPSVPAGLLDAQTAWSAYFERVLGFDTTPNNLADWLVWAALKPNATRTLVAEDPALIDLLAAYLEATHGPAARLFLRYLNTATQSATSSVAPPSQTPANLIPLALGLAADAAFRATQADTKLAVPAAQILKGLEHPRYLGEHSLKERAAERFAQQAAHAWDNLAALSLDAAPHRDEILGATAAHLDRILRDETHDAAQVATHSAASRLGWNTLLQQASNALQSDATDALTNALNALKSHHLAPQEASLLRTLKDAGALAFYLRQADPIAPNATVATLAARYVEDLSFVDRLRESLTGCDPGDILRPAVDRLINQALDASDQFNQAFATDLRRQLAAGPTVQHTLAVHQVLDEVVRPLAHVKDPRRNAKPGVLLVLLDGLSWSVARALLADPALLRGRAAWTPARNAHALPMLAALPSVTAFSRTSLLTGKLQPGDQHLEAKQFPTRLGLPSVLFHKKELDAAGRGNVGPEVTQALADPKNRVVGVVLNAIDDQLDASEQVALDWTLDALTPLRSLLALAADRHIILVGDHGHIWETDTQRDSAQAAHATTARWRPDAPKSAAPTKTNAPAQTGEMRFEGPMIQALTGEPAIIAPYSERVRYTGQKRGYHGGASAQELITPLIILTREDVELPHDAFQYLKTAEPAWYRMETVVDAPEAPSAPQKAKKPKKPTAQLDLIPQAAPAPAPPQNALLQQLLDSPIFEDRLQRLGSGLNPADIAKCLAALRANHDRLSIASLAHTLALTPLRAQRVFTAISTVLNRDGYQIFEIDRTQGFVRLHPDRLKTQFQL